MPLFDYSGFTNIGAGIGNTIAEKKKRDKEKEDRMRVARMLQQYGFPIQTVSDVATGADPGLAIGLAEDQEKKFKEQDKANTLQAKKDAATAEFDRRMQMSPVNPGDRTRYADLTPDQQDNYWSNMAESNAKSERNALAGVLASNPERKMSVDDLKKLYPDTPDKWIKYNNKSWGDIQADENKTPQEPRDRVFDIQVGQRREIAKIRGLKEGSPEWREYVYGLNVQGEFPNDRSIGGLVAQAYRDLKQLENQKAMEAARTAGIPAGSPFRFEYTPMTEDQMKAEAVRTALGIRDIQKQAIGGQAPTPASGTDVSGMPDDELEALLKQLKADSTGANY